MKLSIVLFAASAIAAPLLDTVESPVANIEARAPGIFSFGGSINLTPLVNAQLSFSKSLLGTVSDQITSLSNSTVTGAKGQLSTIQTQLGFILKGVQGLATTTTSTTKGQIDQTSQHLVNAVSSDLNTIIAQAHTLKNTLNTTVNAQASVNVGNILSAITKLAGEATDAVNTISNSVGVNATVAAGSR